MSWLFSRALVEEFSPQSCSATEPSAQLNVMPTQHLFWRNDKTMDCSRFSRFGLTFAALTPSHGEALLTAYLAAFPARTSASQAPALGLTENAPASGASLPASFAWWSPQSFGWKTAQCSLLEDSSECLQTLPRWGSMRNGMLYLRQTLAPGISVSGCGSLLPTLTVCGNYNAKGASPTSGDGLATALKRLPTLDASQHKYRLTGESQQSRSLEAMSRTGALGRLPTLTARDWRSEKRTPEGRAEREQSSRGYTLPATFERNGEGGPLNPNWCEWFMGFPIGWTASDALAMPRYHEWRQQHSPRSPSNSTKEAA